MFVFVSLILFSSTMSIANAEAEEVTDSVQEVVIRSSLKKYYFNSYPPENYKGMKLKKVEKVSNKNYQYVGYYM